MIKRTYNRFNHKRVNSFTPRQKQMIFRRFLLAFMTLLIALTIGMFASGMFFKVKAADNYKKYYKSIEVHPGDTLSMYALTYGEHYRSYEDFIDEVCVINSIEEDGLKAGNHIIVPYYSTEKR